MSKFKRVKACLSDCNKAPRKGRLVRASYGGLSCVDILYPYVCTECNRVFESHEHPDYYVTDKGPQCSYVCYLHATGQTKKTPTILY